MFTILELKLVPFHDDHDGDHDDNYDDDRVKNLNV